MTQDACRQVEYPALGRTVLRPTRYLLSPDPHDLPPWALAMRRLWSNGYTASQIREFLYDLPSSVIMFIESNDGWQHDGFKRLLQRGSGIVLSLRQVKYHLAAMGLRRKRGLRHTKALPELRQIHAACQIRDMGWGEYLPLTISEAKLLTTLEQFSELSRKALESMSGVRLGRRNVGTTPRPPVEVGPPGPDRRVCRDPLQQLIRHGLVVKAQSLMRGYKLASDVKRRNCGVQVEERLSNLVDSL